MTWCDMVLNFSRFDQTNEETDAGHRLRILVLHISALND